jgi:hypothetical protein
MIVKVIWHAGPKERLAPHSFLPSMNQPIPIRLDGNRTASGRLLRVSVASDGLSAEAVFGVGPNLYAGWEFTALREEFAEDPPIRTIKELRVLGASIHLGSKVDLSV